MKVARIDDRTIDFEQVRNVSEVYNVARLFVTRGLLDPEKESDQGSYNFYICFRGDLNQSTFSFNYKGAESEARAKSRC